MQNETAAQPPVLCTQRGEVVTVTLNRPDSMNALNFAMAEGLREAIAAIATNATARLVLLRGAGSSFCAGGDVAAMHAHRDDLPGFIDRMITSFHACVLGLKRLPMPVLACAQGALAGGGFSLAMACDLVLATRSARFVVAYSQLGATADGGLSYVLPQRLGPARGLEALTTAGQFNAEQALALGLVNRLVADEEMAAQTERWAAQLLALAPQSLRELKGLVAVQSIDALAQHLDREKAAFLRCAATAEFAARVAAFAQKRAA